jgi:hypothetical protein
MISCRYDLVSDWRSSHDYGDALLAGAGAGPIRPNYFRNGVEVAASKVVSQFSICVMVQVNKTCSTGTE